MLPSRLGPRLAWSALLAILAVLSIVPAASGQVEDPAGPADPTSTTVADGAVALFGTLQDAAHGPVAGADIEVEGPEGFEASATTRSDGTWRVVVPQPGRYAVHLDVDSLPEGVTLRNSDLATLDNVRVLEGRDKLVNFSLGEPVARDHALASGNRYVTQAWSGIVVGLVIALTAVGLSLVFGATGLVNFAHGEMVTFGAIVAWFFSARSVGLAWSLFVAGAIAVVLSALFGVVLDRGLWRPLERRRLNLVSMMIVSIGLAMLLRYVYAVVFNASPRPFREFSAQRPWEWGPLVFPPKQLAIAALAIVVIVVYALALQRTRLGTAIRAVSDNRDLSESSGIDVQRVVMLVWLGGSALAGLGGVAYAALYSVEWDMGFRLLLPIFAAVVLGGLGTAYGPLVGGLVIGLVSELSTIWFPAEFKFAWALAALAVVLVIRPQGILGRAERIG